jgi:hypothetical protein
MSGWRGGDGGGVQAEVREKERRLWRAGAVGVVSSVCEMCVCGVMCGVEAGCGVGCEWEVCVGWVGASPTPRTTSEIT